MCQSNKEIYLVKNHSLNSERVSLQKQEFTRSPEPALDIYGSIVAALGNSLEIRRKIYTLRNDIGTHVKRVYPCGRFVVANAKYVSAARGKESGKSFYTNLQTCKSVWCCPVCSLKISTYRAAQVRQITANAKKAGYEAFFLTLTIPHNPFQSLKMLQETVSNGFRKMTNTRAYKSLVKAGLYCEVDKKVQQTKEKDYANSVVDSAQGNFNELYKLGLWHEIDKMYGGVNVERDRQASLIGRVNAPSYIRALELTHGGHGWHPHLHVLFFYKGTWEDNGKMLGDALMGQWLHTVAKMGFDASPDAQKAVPVYSEEGITDYITKWDLSKELTEGHTKKTSRTPFTLFDEYQKTGNTDLLNLFKEFALAFHGVNQLTFSRGLKNEFLTTEDKTDEEILKDESIDMLLFNLELPIWKEIKQKGLEADVLAAYDEAGIDGVCEIINSYLDSYVIIEDELWIENNKKKKPEELKRGLVPFFKIAP